MITWPALESACHTCVRCPLSDTRTQAVFDNSLRTSPVAFIGEAPGPDEDRRGLPFVGRSGQYLRSLLASAFIDPESVYISNVVKCFPPGCRRPLPHELLSCRYFLYWQLRLLSPALIVTLGQTAYSVFTSDSTSLAAAQATFRYSTNFDTPYLYYPLYHPARIARARHALEPLYRQQLAALRGSPQWPQLEST